jgi:hypothetical protein
MLCALWPVMTPQIHQQPQQRPPRGRERAARWLSVVLAPLLLLLFMFASPRLAHAEHGDPVSWSLGDASEEVYVGRAVIRYEPGLSEAAFELAEQLPGWWSEIEESFGRDLDDAVTIHLVSHAGMVAKATNMPVWVSGVAHPPSGVIAISMHDPDGSRSDLDTLLQHELVHVALYRATNGAELPRWFHEGVAESFANEISLLRAEALAGAVFGGGVPDIDRLETYFHGDSRQANVAYAAARDFATWLRYHDPESAEFRQLLSQLHNGRPFEQAFVDAYGVNLAELDSTWRSGLFGRFMWFPLLGSGELPFLLIGPIVVVAWIRRRRRLANDWARLDAQEEAERDARLERLTLGTTSTW